MKIISSIILLALLPGVSLGGYYSVEDIENAYHLNLINEEVYNKLLDLYEEKLDINKATYEELLFLPELNKYQAYNIIEYRRVFGFFRQPEELLKVEGINQEDFAALKIFITTENQVAESWDNILKLKTQHASNTGDYQLAHYRVKNPWRKLTAAVVLEENSRYENYRLNNYYAYHGSWKNKARINKYYLAWEPAKLINKIYLGDYLLGFGQGLTLNITGRASAAGIYPGDLTQQLNYYKTQGTWRGAAVALQQDYLNETLFYSNKRNPYYGFSIENLPGRKFLENYYREELAGFNASGFLFTETEVAVTYFASRRYLKGNDIWRYPPDDHNFSVYGTNFSTYLGQVNFAGELSKVAGYGQAMFAQATANFGRLSGSASFRSYDDDYYNPHAGSYSRHYPLNIFKCRDEKGNLIKLRWLANDILNLDFHYDQYSHRGRVYWDYGAQNYKVVYGNTVIDREIFGACRLSPSEQVAVNTTMRYNDRNIYKDVKGDKITTSVALVYQPEKRIQTLIKYYVRKYLNDRNTFYPEDYIVTRLAYRITTFWQIKGEVKYRKFSLYRDNSGVREYFLETKYKIKHGIDLKARYNNIYKPGGILLIESDDEADLLSYNDAYLQDKFSAELVLQW